MISAATVLIHAENKPVGFGKRIHQRMVIILQTKIVQAQYLNNHALMLKE
jgi:hypothetical protein